MAKVTPRDKRVKDTVLVKTTSGSSKKAVPHAWWKANSKEERARQVIDTASFLKEQQQYRFRQAALYARLYSNYPLYGWANSNLSRMSVSSQLPSDRPTLNVIQSCIDTKVSRITQSKPRPMFLTDNGDYKQRKLSKQLNNFILGEFHQAKVYRKGEDSYRDSNILGDGILKVFKNNGKVNVERVIAPELLVDPNDGMYGNPRQMYQMALVDRSILMEMFPSVKSKIMNAEQGYPDSSSEKTVADQIMVVEAWHLPSSKDANDGMHVIACSEGSINDEQYDKDRFPFVFLQNNKRVLGYWGQGASERLMGTQVEINKLLMTISNSINIMGVPRVLIEDGSKIVKAHINNQVGSIITYRGNQPIFAEGTSGIGADIYAQLQRLVGYAYQQEGVSTMAAQAQKPAGLNSGEAIRNYDDIQSDRFSSEQRGYAEMYEDLAYLILDTACDIAKEEGSYSTVYPNKVGAKEINLPEIEDDVKNKFIIQCFDVSALPKEPAGRLQKITEMIQAGMIDIREGRRLLDFPDLDQVEQLANAAEERILQILDAIVEDGEYTPPDPFMDLQLAQQLSVQYYNLYVASKLEEEKAELLRKFNTQVKAFITQASQPAPAASPEPVPQAVPEPSPVSDLIPNVPGAVA